MIQYNKIIRACVLSICLFFLCSSLRNYLYNRSNINGTPDKITLRIMAKHELGIESDYTVLKTKSSEFSDNEKIKNVEEGVSIYERIQKSNSQKFKGNKKVNKNKYANKKGISKLDCYCEEKIFSRIDEIKNLAKNMGNEKSNLKKLLYKKYGLKFTISFLFPIIGLIVSSLSCSGGWEYKNSILGANGVPEDAVSSVSIIIIIASFTLVLVIIYILIKIIKYEKLKAGKGKMSAKEYCRFCNEIFRRG
ncbi:Plasmodium exported protein, unknown function [Plasmodium vivax]|uniref:Variable surface protein n=1 Tax=Plasmodium vivax TaxID=5855 RepID=A0A1G4HEZ2_PLAVI|nr:Plasmodium exported protein, unknown function [Plasmodium vivax]